MSSDPNKKSPRTFQCRDVLWETFEQMARELECSVDYLINEAMKQYARQRSYGSRTPFPVQGRGVEAQVPPSSDHRERGGFPQPPMPSNVPPPPVPPPPPMGGLSSTRPLPPPPGGARFPAPPPPARPQPSAPPPQVRGGHGGLPAPPPRGAMAMPPMQARPGAGIPQPPRSVPPPLPRAATPVPPQAQNGYPAPPPHGATLSIVYQGEKLPITKDRFVIGRGKQSSDLTLKDPNVSRQHAMIEFQNGVYFMVDMGSTNGVEFNGQRIARKQIAEGDVFKICDHDLVFTYR